MAGLLERKMTQYEDFGIRLGQALNTLDVSADQRVAAFGGSNHLILTRISRDYRVMELEESVFVKNMIFGDQKLSLKPILKVKFNPTFSLAHLLASSTSNGAVAVWNILQAKGNMGQWKPEYVLKEHTQAVSTICWHFSNPQTLLTGSNDSKIKMWDLRVKSRSTLTLSSTPKSFVRDVEFRKVEGSHRFASAMENGLVQVWDVRHPKTPEVSFSAHEAALTVDWNPEISHLVASAGRDGFIKIWDVFQQAGEDSADPSNEEESSKFGAAASGQPAVTTSNTATTVVSQPPSRRIKKRRLHLPVQTIETVEKHIAKVMWRPGHPYQIASVPIRGTKVHLWNTLEPNIPLATIDACEENDSVSGFVWLDQCLSKGDVIGSSLHSTYWWGDDDDDEGHEDVDEDHHLPASLYGAGQDNELVGKLRSSIIQGHRKNNLSVKVPLHAHSVNGTSSPDGNLSLAGSTASRETSNLALSGDADSESFSRRKEQQRLRFRQFKHRHRQEDDSQRCWGIVVSCSADGAVDLRSVENASNPLQSHPANALSISCNSRLAVSFDTIPYLRTVGALLLNKQLLPNEQEPRPSAKVSIFTSQQLRRNWESTQASDSIKRIPGVLGIKRTGSFCSTFSEPCEVPAKQFFSSAILGFDPDQFKLLAKSYVTPKTTSHESTSFPMAPDIFGEHEATHIPRRRTPEDIAHCCAANARVADAAAAPAIAQVWRLLRLLFAPLTAEEQVNENLLTVNVKDKDALLAALQRVTEEGKKSQKKDGGKKRIKRRSVVSINDGMSSLPEKIDFQYMESEASGADISMSSTSSIIDRPPSPNHRLFHPSSPDIASPPRSPASSIASASSAYFPQSSTSGGPGSTGSHTPRSRMRRKMRAASASNLAQYNGGQTGQRGRKSMDSMPQNLLPKRSFDSFDGIDQMGPRSADLMNAESGSDGEGLGLPLDGDNPTSENTLLRARGSSLLEAASDVGSEPRGRKGSPDLSLFARERSISEDDLRDRSGAYSGFDKRAFIRTTVAKTISKGPKEEDSPGLVESKEPPPLVSPVRRAKIISVTDPFPMFDQTSAHSGQWLAPSLNLLCRLNCLNPIEESKFKIDTWKMDQDKRELNEALSLAKPMLPPAPVPVGHRKLRKQQRMLRRQQFSYYYNLMYQKQREAFASYSAPSDSKGFRASRESGDEIEQNDSVLDNADSVDQQHPEEEGVLDELGGKDSHGSTSHGANRGQGVETPSVASDEQSLRQMDQALDGKKLRQAEEIFLPGVSPLVLSPFALVTGNKETLRSRLVHNILSYHAEIGDVQTCAMIVLILGEMLQPQVEKKLMRMWLCSYIDLLQQLQVFSIAARIISACEDQEVERWYQMTSMVAEGCSSCAETNKKNIIRANPNFKGVCSTCKGKVSRCAICDHLVRGMYVWCQGCGHGGHLDHISQWFLSENVCPTGCGHRCAYNFDVEMKQR